MIVKDTRLSKAVFLDRDGTISSDQYGYISNPDEYKIYPNTGTALSLLRSAGYYIFIVTNQSGIARGYFDTSTLDSVHARMRELVTSAGATIDRVFYSPYYKDGVVEPYNIDHEDRKPGIGMFRQARAEYSFRPEQSWMIGDRYSDIAFGHNAGLKTILVLTGDGQHEFTEMLPSREIRPDFIVPDVLAAAQLITTYYP